MVRQLLYTHVHRSVTYRLLSLSPLHPLPWAWKGVITNKKWISYFTLCNVLLEIWIEFCGDEMCLTDKLREVTLYTGHSTVMQASRSVLCCPTNIPTLCHGPCQKTRRECRLHGPFTPWFLCRGCQLGGQLEAAVIKVNKVWSTKGLGRKRSIRYKMGTNWLGSNITEKDMGVVIVNYKLNESTVWCSCKKG